MSRFAAIAALLDEYQLDFHVHYLLLLLNYLYL